jgi:hypothetical protein
VKPYFEVSVLFHIGLFYALHPYFFFFHQTQTWKLFKERQYLLAHQQVHVHSRIIFRHTCVVAKSAR